MKRVLIFIVALTFSLNAYTSSDRILDMQKMAQAMQDIQSGFFYNNLDIVKAGVEDLKTTIIKVGPTVEEINNKDVYERWLLNSTAMKKRTQRNIIRRADTIVDRFRTGDAVQALQEYSKITYECMKCHIRLRNW